MQTALKIPRRVPLAVAGLIVVTIIIWMIVPDMHLASREISATRPLEDLFNFSKLLLLWAPMAMCVLAGIFSCLLDILVFGDLDLEMTKRFTDLMHGLIGGVAYGSVGGVCLSLLLGPNIGLIGLFVGFYKGFNDGIRNGEN